MYYVYILQSKKDGHYYIGQTASLEKRLARHRKGLVPSTRGRLPLTLLFYETYASRAEAMRREKFLKSGAGHREIQAKVSIPDSGA